MHWRRAVLGVVVLVLAALVGACGSPPPAPESTAGRLCAQDTELTQRRGDQAAPVTTGRGTTVVLGDSYAQGLGAADPRRQSWPALVGAARGETVWVDAAGATGFVNGGFCRNRSFPTRVGDVLARRPDLVIVQGGLNDATSAPAALSAGVNRVLGALHDVPRVVVVGPAAVPAVPADKVRGADATIRDATARAGREYVSALTWAFPMLSDRIHPTVQGQQLYAGYLLPALGRPAGVR